MFWIRVFIPWFSFHIQYIEGKYCLQLFRTSHCNDMLDIIVDTVVYNFWMFIIYRSVNKKCEARIHICTLALVCSWIKKAPISASFENITAMICRREVESSLKKEPELLGQYQDGQPRFSSCGCQFRKW